MSREFHKGKWNLSSRGLKRYGNLLPKTYVKDTKPLLFFLLIWLVFYAKLKKTSHIRQQNGERKRDRTRGHFLILEHCFAGTLCMSAMVADGNLYRACWIITNAGLQKHLQFLAIKHHRYMVERYGTALTSSEKYTCKQMLYISSTDKNVWASPFIHTKTSVVHTR